MDTQLMPNGAMLDRVARYPAWLAIAMMAPFVGMLIAAATLVPFDACGRVCPVAGNDMGAADRALAAAFVVNVHGDVVHVRYRLVRVIIHPV